MVLVLLLIFILQNSRKVQISYLGAHGHLPLGVALLFAAVRGILLVVIPGTARIANSGSSLAGIARSMPDASAARRSRRGDCFCGRQARRRVMAHLPG